MIRFAPSVKDGFHVLADFWKKIWHWEEAMPRLSELQALCDSQTWREPFPEGDMWFPSAAQLMVRAQETKGTAPGLRWLVGSGGWQPAYCGL